MNSTVSFPPQSPPLKLTRSSEKWAATLTEERRRLQEDQDALREREANLRDYEGRLRNWQAEIDAGRGGAVAVHPVATIVSTPTPFQRRSSQVPFAGEPSLPAAWDKLHRARELLEAEQVHLKMDREQVRELQATNKCLAEELVAREARLAERELLVIAATPPSPGEPVAAEHTMSVMTRFTRGPFDMARSVFGVGKQH